MELFYCHPENIYSDYLKLDKFETRHIVKTLRKKTGDQLNVTDGNGNHFLCVIKDINEHTKCIISSKTFIKKSPKRTALAIGFIKPNRMELLIEKCTELGVNHFIFFRSAFSNYFSDNLERYLKIARQSIKQSMQFYLPEIKLFSNFNDFISSVRNHPKKIVAMDKTYPKLKSINLKNNNLICIGPEGGFNKTEIEILNENNFVFASLGENRLRSETAAISAASIICL